MYGTIGGRTALDIATEVCSNAAATIAVGALCLRWWSGAAKPNPTGALGVHEAVPGIKVINMAGCPHNPANTAAVLVHYLTFDDVPDSSHRPTSVAYGRRPLLRDANAAPTMTLAALSLSGVMKDTAKVGVFTRWVARGPSATFNCPVAQWNDLTSWPIRAGHGCIACASPRFWDNVSPFDNRLPNVPEPFGVRNHRGRNRPRTYPVLSLPELPCPRLSANGKACSCAVRSRASEGKRKTQPMSRLVVDPVSRIEGHLRVEANL
jgi:hydrogenase small subunit